MEENSDAHMETDVSSTTDDVPETPQVTGSHGDIEMIVVVEQLKEEEDNSIDQGFKRATPSTSTDASPQKQSTPQRVIKPLIDNDISEKLSNKLVSVNSNMYDIVVQPSTVTTQQQQLVSSDSPQKAELTASPGKSIENIVEKNPIKITEIAIEKSPIKISPIQNVKSPYKEVKLATKTPIKLIKVSEKPVSNDITAINKSPKDIKEKPNKEACLVNISNKEIKLPEQSVKTVTHIENRDNQEKVSESLNGKSVTSLKLPENSPVKEPQQATSTDISMLSKGSDLGNQSCAEDNQVQSPTKVSSNEVSILGSSNLNTDTVSDNVPQESKTSNAGDKMGISTPLNDSLININNSQNTLDSESHNKSISRELKSLINSAKESKIINECTQLKSKTRKSRLDISNTSLNSDADKIGNRRSSSNSQISNSSEKSDKALKRSMRSQNPEFANKCKQFLNSLTNRVMKDSDDAMSDDEPKIPAEKSVKGLKHDTAPTSAKKKKVSDQSVMEDKDSNKKFRSDGYCWRCHWIVEQEENDKAHPPLHCTVCPRSFHYKCLTTSERKISSEKSWVCPDCLLILQAEGSDTRSPAMKKTSLGTLCDLLKYALERMMDLNGVEPFMSPVDRAAFPDYDKYVVHPMDLSQMKKNITDGLYGSTEAFVADVQWILHNSIIFNTCEQAFLQSKLTGGARALVRSCRAEMGEIEACPECYAAAHARRATWFTDVCTTPHILLWAKLKGFPYWPAKGMSVNSSGLVDVRFFGAHDRAWVPAKDCFLFSEKDPNNFRNKRQDILDSMQEAELHIRNISRKYGKFVYPPFKTQFEPSKLMEQIKMMIPSFEGEIPPPIKDKSVTASPLAKVKRRSNSKGSKSSAYDGDGSESEDTASSARTEAIQFEKSTSEKSVKADSPASKLPVPLEEPLVTRKRRRSNLEEASVMSVIEPSRAVPEKKTKVEQQEPSSSKETAHSTTKESESEPTKKKSDVQKNKPKDEEPSSTQDEKESLRVTPIKLVALPRANKQTPKMFATTKAPSNPNSPKTEEKTPLKIKTKPDKTSDKSKEEKTKKHRNSKSNKSLNGSSTPKSSKTIEKKTGSESEKETKTKEKNTEIDTNKSAPDSSKTAKSMKDRLNFDDDTSLAVIARERRKSTENLPTISSVCSLSTTAQTSLPTPTPSTSAPRPGAALQASSSSSVFTPTSTDSVRNMKDAANKLQKIRDNTEPVVGRVGVRAFARMTSPDRPDCVEVEIKAEPIDMEEDEVRLSEKMDLMTACKLQPVNQSLRDVRINRVTAGPAKKAEPRPRARKTFPQPRASEGRSELNGKNSMVYIPIQPPATQPPVRAARPPASTIRLSSPAAVAGNNTVNTIITPLKPTTTHSSPSVVSVPTVAQGPMPTVGQVSLPTVGQVPSVHTVPLMTSVNGQWMFSLQPIMSVGGVDNVNSTPLVNGNAPPVIVPISSAAVNATAQPNRTNDNTSEAQLPRLHARAQELCPVSAPPTAGPLSTKIHQHAQKLTELFRTLIEDTIEKNEEPAAAATALRLQLEQARWRHAQELEELNHNHELTLSEMRLSFEKDKLRIASETKRATQAEFEAVIKQTKSKQWCANCYQEAQFYCCWNTSYCDYPCQRAHWPQHCASCAQRGKDGNGDEAGTPESRLQAQPDVLPALQKSTAPSAPAAPLTVGGKVARVFSPQDGAHQKTSIIVSMVEDTSGNSTMKCVGTYKPAAQQNQMPSLIINKQVMSEESSKKVVTSGGYLIVGAGSAASVITPAQARRATAVQYFT